MKHVYYSYYLDSPLQEGRVFDVFEPETITKDTAIFMVHGGGWRSGTRTVYHKLMEAFCNQGYIVASTDYRLDAKNAFEQLSDIRESYDRFVTLLKEKGRPVRIAVHGGSAGAHLASLLVCAEPGECGETVRLHNEWVKPSSAVLQATPADFLPWEGMMPHFWNIMQDIAGVPYDQDADAYERLSLKNYIRSDNPPIFFMEAELEYVFLPEHTQKIADAHQSLGINSMWKVYSKMEHGFFYNLERKCQREAFEDFCAFIDID